MLRTPAARSRFSVNHFPRGFTPPLTPRRQGEGNLLADVALCEVLFPAHRHDPAWTRPLGIRLRVADVATGVCLRGSAACPPHRLPALLLHLLGASPRH